MNQGTLDVVKQEMARVNIDILISELKWVGMDEFNSNIIAQVSALEQSIFFFC